MKQVQKFYTLNQHDVAVEISEFEFNDLANYFPVCDDTLDDVIQDVVCNYVLIDPLP